MRVLLTGGCGFIGSYLAERLLASGHEVASLDLVAPKPGSSFARSTVGDVRDLRAVRKALAECDAVFHLAAAHHDFGIARDTYFDVNERGAEVLVEAMDGAGIRRLCFFSTAAVYGDTPEPRHEGSPTNPVSPYGASKLAGERVFERWVAQGDGRTALIIRPTVVFGPKNFANMYSLIRQIDRGRFLRVGPGTNIKSLSYVENLVDATLMLWGKSDRPAFDVYNYIDKPDLNSRQIAEAVYAGLGKSPPGIAVPLPLALALALPFDAFIALTGRNLPVSSARIKKLASFQTKFEADKLGAAGFRPKISLSEGIRRMVSWYLAEGHARDPVWRVPPRDPLPLTSSEE